VVSAIENANPRETKRRIEFGGARLRDDAVAAMVAGECIVAKRRVVAAITMRSRGRWLGNGLREGRLRWNGWTVRDLAAACSAASSSSAADASSASSRYVDVREQWSEPNDSSFNHLLLIFSIRPKWSYALTSPGSGNELEENALCRSGCCVCYAGRFVHKGPSPVASQSHFWFDFLRERDDADSVAA
jgi:hypothetical protein